MVLEITKEVQGIISEDEKEAWQSVESFQFKHSETLTLSDDETNDISLKEVKKVDTKELKEINGEDRKIFSAFVPSVNISICVFNYKYFNIKSSLFYVKMAVKREWCLVNRKSGRAAFLSVV